MSSNAENEFNLLFIALDARLWSLDSAFGRRSPSPGGRRFEEILPVAEEVALVWGLRYCGGTASWKEASRDEGRGSRAIRQISSRHQPLASGHWTLDSSSGLRAGEFFAVKDVSFELRRGELRTPGRSEKEISKNSG